MIERLSNDVLDAEAAFLRPLLCRPPWHRPAGLGDCDHRHVTKEQLDTGTRALFRRYRPGLPPHGLTPELRGAVWQRASFFPDALATETDRVRAVDHAALVLHLLARGPAASPDGVDLGTACRKAGLTDARFTRLMGTPQPQRLQTLSRLMQRLGQAGTPVRWVVPNADGREQSRPWTLRDTRTDEVLPVLTFLFGYEADPVVARWAKGFFGTRAGDEAGEETASVEEA